MNSRTNTNYLIIKLICSIHLLAFPVKLCSEVESDSIESKSQLVYHVPLGSFEKLLEKYKADFILYDDFFVDTLKGNLCVGFRVLDRKNYRIKFLMIDSSGNIIKEWRWVEQNELRKYLNKGVMSFRCNNALIYFAGDKDTCFVLTDSLILASNPWYFKNVKDLFLTVPIEYVRSAIDTNETFPLFRFNTTKFFSVTQNGAIYIYSKKMKSVEKMYLHKEFKQISLEYWLRLDPFIGVFNNMVLFWGFYYDINSKKIVYFKNQTGKYSKEQIGEVLGEGDYSGISYFIWNDNLFFFFYTQKGLFIYKFVD